MNQLILKLLIGSYLVWTGNDLQHASALHVRSIQNTLVFKRHDDFHLQFSKVYDPDAELLSHLMDLDSLSNRLQVLHDLNNLIVSNEDIDMNTIKRTATSLQKSTNDIITTIQNKVTSWLPSARFFYICLIVIIVIATCMITLIICLRCRRPHVESERSRTMHDSIEAPLHATVITGGETTSPPPLSSGEPSTSHVMATAPPKRKMHDEIIRFQDLLRDDSFN